MHKAIAAGIVVPLLFLTACSDTPEPTAEADDKSAGSPAPPDDRGDTSNDHTWSPQIGGGLKGDWERLRPAGFIELRLGMTREEALGVGRITIGETANGCTGFHLAMYGDGSGLGPHGYFSDHGLAVIHGQGGMHTPEGVALGTPVDELRRTYPALRRSDGLLTVPASDEADYFFIVQDEIVNYFGLTLSGDPCATRAFE